MDAAVFIFSIVLLRAVAVSGTRSGCMYNFIGQRRAGCMSFMPLVDDTCVVYRVDTCGINFTNRCRCVAVTTLLIVVFFIVT